MGWVVLTRYCVLEMLCCAPTPPCRYVATIEASESEVFGYAAEEFVASEIYKAEDIEDFKGAVQLPPPADDALYTGCCVARDPF